MTKIKIMLPTIESVKEFVNLTNRQEFECDISSGKYAVDGKSIMGIFSMDLSKPLVLTIHSDNCAEFLKDTQKFLA